MTYPRPFIAAASLIAACCIFAMPAPALAQAANTVTADNFIRAETDRYFYDIQQKAGGINKFFKIRQPTPIDGQTVVRMNKDTLYSAAVVDTKGGAWVTMPKIPKGRYAWRIQPVDATH